MKSPFSNFEIPPSFTVTTGGEEECLIIEARDEFFRRTLGAIGMSMSNPFVELQTRALSSPERGAINGFHASDDFLHELVVRDTALAMVLDRRNGFNSHEVSFYLNHPNEQAVSWLAEVQDSQATSIDNE